MLTGRVVNFVNSTRRHGFMKTIARDWNRLRELIYEGRLGIRSREIISLKELGLEHEERRQHYPTQLSDFWRMKKFLQPETQNEVFVDYGAGLGRVVILAAMLPFKRVIGVELSPVLAERARENVRRCKGKLHCKDVDVVNADATAFEIPIDTTTIFFNNPFAGQILASVLERIKFSHKKQPRRIKLVCNLPMESAFGEQIRQAEGLELQHEVKLSEGRRCFVYLVQKEVGVAI
jgi:predicted RNA methylase